MNKIYSFAACFLSIFYLSAPEVQAQTTGSFNTTITFAGQPRALSLYVPPNYNAANPCRLMVCLHGLGDNSNNYRNALINSLAMQNLFTNTIFVCPDGGSDQLKDFYTPAGDEAIIDSAIAYVMANYTINSSDKILQGFSLGGRSALRYGLDHPSAFKGLLLNTPAVQGVKEGLNLGAVNYNYSNATGMPIYITHGGTDVIYTGPIDTALHQLILHNAAVKLNRVASLGHTVFPAALMPELPAYFDTPATEPYDIDLAAARTPVRSCQASYNIDALFRNTGTQPVTSADFEYTINGGTPQAISWTGSLASFEHAALQIPVTSATATSAITLKVTDINGAIPDTIVANNERQTSFEHMTSGAPLPYTEGFESPSLPAGWINEWAGDFVTWEVDNTVSFSGNSSMFSFNTALVFDNSGRREVLYTPLLDLSGTTAPQMNFDLTANYHRFTPPYVLDTLNLADTLEVAASADCGQTWQVLYRKAGADLATFAQPVINPLSINAAYQVPTAADWRKEYVNLNAVAGNNDVVLRISYISGLGGWINIDNVAVTPNPTVVTAVTTPLSFSLYPNPAKESATLTCDEQIKKITVVNMQGRLITSIPANEKSVVLQTAAWAPGIYMVQVQTANGSATRKLVVE